MLVLTYGTVMLMHVARLAMNMPLTHGACVHACQHAGMRHAKGPRAVPYARAVRVRMLKAQDPYDAGIMSFVAVQNQGVCKQVC